MKRNKLLVILSLCFCMLFACSESVEEQWQEQYDLGIRYLSEGNYEEAIIAFTAAIEIDPIRPEAYIGRGDAHLAAGASNENLDAALEDYQTALSLDDNNEEVYIKIADVYITQEQYELALDILQQAIDKIGESENIQSKIEEIYATYNPEGNEDALAEGLQIFDETYWHWNISPGVAGNYYVLFHTDGTFSWVQIPGSMGQEFFEYGTSKYEYVDSLLIIDGVEYIGDESGFQSSEALPASGAGDQGWYYFLAPDSSRGYETVTTSPEFIAYRNEREAEAEGTAPGTLESEQPEPIPDEPSGESSDEYSDGSTGIEWWRTSDEYFDLVFYEDGTFTSLSSRGVEVGTYDKNGRMFLSNSSDVWQYRSVDGVLEVSYSSGGRVPFYLNEWADTYGGTLIGSWITPNGDNIIILTEDGTWVESTDGGLSSERATYSLSSGIVIVSSGQDGFKTWHYQLDNRVLNVTSPTGELMTFYWAGIGPNFG